MKKTNYRFGWIPDVPDNRDHLYSAEVSVLGALPTSVDLRSKCPAVYDQGQLGSCTANALAGVFQHLQKKQGIPNWIPSRLFLYYNERVIINTVNSDSGANIRDGIKTLNKQGICAESNWAYDINKFTVKPPQVCYDKALTNQILTYQRIDNSNLNQIKACLAGGYPIAFGFAVYESFMKIGKSGVMPLPKSSEKLLGGHAVEIVGFDDKKQWCIIRNSWGTSWGDKGYFYMPYSYITNRNQCDDFWTIRLVESGIQIFKKK